MFEKLHNNAGLIFPLIAAGAALAFSGSLDPYLAFVATSWVIFGLLGLSLDVIWGRGGFLSLAQTAFYGLGATSVPSLRSTSRHLWAWPCYGRSHLPLFLAHSLPQHLAT